MVHTLSNLRVKHPDPDAWASENAKMMPLVRLITGSTPDHSIDIVAKGVFPDPTETRPDDELDELLERLPATYFFAGHVYPKAGQCVFVLPSSTVDDLSGTVSPFDSGGLIDYHSLVVDGSDKRQYLRDHEAKTADYQDYFTLHLQAHFKTAINYLDGPPLKGIDGYKRADDMDHMSWAFEIRQETSLELPLDTDIFVLETVYNDFVEALEQAPNIANPPNIQPVSDPSKAAKDRVRELLENAR